MQKEDQNSIYRIVQDHVPKSVIVVKNKSKTWEYGYNEKYDMVVISKDGTIGDIYSISGLLVALPSTPDDVYKRDNKKENQYWQPSEYPRELSNIKTIFNWHTMPKNFKDEWVDYIEGEFDRRDHGFFFMNNGVKTYITGSHYMYLQWTKIDVGLPDYREANRIYFIFWEACKADNRSFGMVYLKIRRSGFSFMGSNELSNTGTLAKDARLGILSKTGNDAKTMFTNKVVPIISNYPFFFKPIQDGMDKPKTELAFRVPAAKITKKNMYESADSDIRGLDTTIDWKNTADNSYDGEKLLLLVHDECYAPDTLILTENLIFKKISEITSLPIEEVSENGIKYYLSGEDENFEQDDFSSIFDTINRALSDAEGSDMYNYYYKEIKNALEELGNVLSHHDEGVKMEIDLLKIPLTYKEISQIMEDKEIDDLEEVFSEAIYSGEIDLPKFNPDDRFQPSADRKEFNSYLRDIGFDEYKNGGELVLKNNTPTKTQNNTIMEDLKFNELPHIDTVSNGDAVLIREEVFGGDMEKPKHIGTRYITCQVMGKGGIAGTLNLKVKKSVGANAYKMNELIERPLRDVIQTGKKLIVEPISDTASKLGMDDLFQGDLVGYKGGNYEVGGVTTCGKFVKCKNDKGLDSEIELEEFMDNSTLIKRKK